MTEYEERARNSGYGRIGGVDEVGRGSLAGPVCASCVILPDGFFSPLIRDSKKLSAVQREEAFDLIKQVAVDMGTGWVGPGRIDGINIYQATRKAMGSAVAGMGLPPDYLLIDAMSLPEVSISQESIKKGDSKSISIAAASIVAKVTRDALMVKLDSVYPSYRFSKNKGYGTSEHMKALREHGPSPIHRKTFKGVLT